MFTHNYLTLRLVRLKSAEEWLNERPRLLFVFPKGDGGKYVSGSKTHRLSTGDILVVEAALGDKICAQTGETIFWWFSACLENLYPLFATNEICLLQNVIEGFKGTKLYRASSQLALECQRLLSDVPPQGDLGHRGQLLRIVSAILSEEFKSVQRQRVGFVRVEEHLIQVFESLSSAEILELSVGELAARFSCSRRHLNRLFHQYFGFSVATLRMEMRLLKAVSLLRNPNAKVINVAEECGFNHLGLFNTCFRRRFGNSPGQWRKTDVKVDEQRKGENDHNAVCPLRSNGLCPWSGKADNLRPAREAASPPQKPAAKRVLPGTARRDQSAEQRALVSGNEIREATHSQNPLPICV
jgi:AraC-like DNA-binding protein